jgi:hypothetical protein
VLDAGRRHVPRGDRIDHPQPGTPCSGVGGPNGESVHRRIGESRDGLTGDDCLGGHAAERIIEQLLDWSDRHEAFANEPLGLFEGNHDPSWEIGPRT